VALRDVPTFTKAAPSPERFFELANAYQSTTALRAAVELDLFTAIHKGAKTAEDIAHSIGGKERGVRILCDFLATDGLLEKRNSSYSLAPDAEQFLVHTSPAYIGSALQFLHSSHVMQNFNCLAATVRGAAPQNSSLQPDHPMWQNFARAMASFMKLPATLIANHLLAHQATPWKVLDIAAGHGMFGITIAQQNPNARIVAVDWGGVLEVAKQNAQAAGVSDHYSTIAGDAFKADWGTGYDLVLLTNFLHHFDFATNVNLLRKVHAALADKGRAATLEFVPNEDRISPKIAARFAMQMLGGTPAGDAFTFSELDLMFREAGFSRTELLPLQPTPESLVISHR